MSRKEKDDEDDDLKILKLPIIALGVSCFALGFNIGVLVFKIITKLKS